jgi:hypothetical protein
MDLKKMSMSELIAMYNERTTGDKVTEFKNLAAARAAVTSLENQMSDTENPLGPDATPITEKSAADKAKYSSTGKRGPNQGVGAFAKELISAGGSNADVLAAVKAKFPDAKTTTGCIAFYRTALNKGPAKASATPEALRAKAQELLAAAEKAEQEAAAKAAEAAPV